MIQQKVCDAASLHWVRKEVDAALDEAQSALERYIDSGHDLVRLDTCIEQLKQVRGSLLLIELYGAAMIGEELEAVARILPETLGERRAQAAEALMQGLIALPEYLDKLSGGMPDVPVSLLSLLNDLRAVRDAPLFTETSLFAPGLEHALDTEADDPGQPSATLKDTVRRLRYQFHWGLLNWYKAAEGEAAASLDQLHEVVDRFREAAGTVRVERLFEALGAVLSGIRQGAIDESVAIKVLVGRLDRVLQTILKQGEEGLLAAFPMEMAKSYLYYVASAADGVPEITMLKDRYHLIRPVASETDVLEGLALLGPSGDAYEAVRSLLLEELVAVKDLLDLAMRRSPPDHAPLTNLVPQLLKIADVFGMIGMGSLRHRLQAQAQAFHERLSSGELPEADGFVSLASDLVYAESSLQGYSFKLARQEAALGGTEEEGTAHLAAGELQSYKTAALRELGTEFEQIKKAILTVINNPQEPSGLQEVSRHLTVALGAMELLQIGGVARLTERVARYFERVAEQGQAAALLRLDPTLIADAISGIEYAVELVAICGQDAHSVLEYTADVMNLIEQREAATVDETVVASTEAALIPAVEPEAEVIPESVAESPSPPVDDEIRQVFLEEAREQLGIVADAYHKWRSSPDEHEALKVLRRGFHTLKGSGRMVGAATVGEFSWAVENLLNRVIDTSITVSDQLFALLDEALAILPALIDREEQGDAEADDTSLRLEARAFDLAGAPLPGRVREALGLESPEAAMTSATEAEEETAESDESAELQVAAFSEGAETAAAMETSAEQAGMDVPEPHEMVEVPETAQVPEAQELAEVAESTEAPELDEGTETPEISEVSEAEASLDASDVSHADLVDQDGEITVDGMVESIEFSAEIEAGDEPASASEVPASTLSSGEESGAECEEASSLEPELVESDTEMDQLLPAEEAEGYDESILTAETAEAEAEETAESYPLVNYDVDPVLADIFCTETQSHLLEINTFLKRSDDKEGGLEVTSDLLRAFHTLNGSANMAGVKPIARLSEAVERLLRDMKSAAMTVDGPTSSQIRAAAAEIGNLLQAVNGPGANDERWRNIRNDIQELHRSLPQTFDRPEPQEEAGFAVPTSVTAPEESEMVTVDPELISIFSEEMRELFDHMERDYGRWQAGDIAAVADLQRVLHTLKGAARLAGISPMGDMSHAFETMLSGMPAPDEADTAEKMHLYLEVARRACDRLMEQGDSILAGRPVPLFRELIAELESPLERSQEGAGAEPVPEMAWQPPVIEQASPAVPKVDRQDERIRVSTDLIDRIIDNVGEVSIYSGRIAQQQGVVQFNLSEFEQTVARLGQQLRSLEIETEAQILYRHEREGGRQGDEDFDPLELDRFSTMQELSRALAETVDDLANLREYLQTANRDVDTLLIQQSRVVTDLQNQLLTTRLVPFAQHVSRLERLTRQTSNSVQRKARLVVEGRATELDRSVLDQTLPLVEHLLRNAVSHGIESPEDRRSTGKPEEGTITLSLVRDGADVVLTVADDGRGLNEEKIRQKAIDLGAIRADQELSEEDLSRLATLPGVSTADEVTQISGRGVGLDVVSSEIKQLGGALEIHSTKGRGAAFTIRLPFTMSITDVLLVQMAGEIFAVPHASVESVVRIQADDLRACYEERSAGFDYAGQLYPVRYFGSLFDEKTPLMGEQTKWLPALLVKSGGYRMALQVDGIVGNRQIVVKSAGPQLSVVPWLLGGTILGDGRVALIVDVASLVRSAGAQISTMRPQVQEAPAQKVTVMVVDDSITVRKVTSRLLERHNMNVVTAKDGVEAVSLMEESHPDLMLLDIEMPRMDGFELARHVRHNKGTANLPIIMVTSRTGDKHRERAEEIGVDGYLGKPYQEDELMDAIFSVLSRVAR